MASKNKNPFKTIGGKVKNIVFSPHPRPKRDWVFVISFFFLGLFVTAVFNSFVFLYYEYYYERSNEGISEETGQPSAYNEIIDKQGKLDLNKEDLNRAWEFFEDKEERFDLIKNEWKITSPLQKDALLEEVEGEEEGEEDELSGQTEEENENNREEEGAFNDEDVFEL